MFYLLGMNKTTMIFALVITLTAVFAIASPMDVATAEIYDTVPESEGEHKDGEYKDGKSCPSKERKDQPQEQSL